MQNSSQFYINGAWVDPTAATEFDVIIAFDRKLTATGYLKIHQRQI